MTSRTPKTFLFSSLKAMVKDCQQVHELLERDSDYFKNNEFTALEESNQHKTKLINRLAELMSEFTSLFPQGLAKAFSVIENEEEKNELGKLTQQLNSEILKCYHYIVMNSGVVFSNLEMLKEVWDKLMSLKSEAIYNESGNIIKP